MQQRANLQRAGECANCYEPSDRLYDPPLYAADRADTRYYSERAVWWKYPGQYCPADICDIVDQDEDAEQDEDGRASVLIVRWADFSEKLICWSCYGQNVAVSGVRYLCNKPPQIMLHGWQKPTWEDVKE